MTIRNHHRLVASSSPKGSPLLDRRPFTARPQALVLLGVAPLIAACSGEVVNLGENSSELVTNSTCAVDTGAPIFVQNQSQLDALAGCEQLSSDLVVFPFEDVDLSPLSALRTVAGTLDLGRQPVLEQDVVGVLSTERILRDQALVAGGWLTSLDGLEALESAGALTIQGLGATSLAPLSNLRALTQGGALELESCTRLRTLEGLENISGLTDVFLRCDSLTTIAGLPLPSVVGNLVIQGTNITDLGDFDVIRADRLSIVATSLTNLDALSSVETAEALNIGNNELLTSVDGVANIGTLSELLVHDNAVLERLPDFVNVSLIEVVDVQDNPLLRNLPSFPSVSTLFLRDQEFELPAQRLNLNADALVVTGNAALEEIIVPSLLPAIRFVQIERNAALTHISFSDMEAADFVSIADNPVLQSVDVGNLAVDDLQVLGNPQLGLDDFDGVRTFEQQLSSEPPPGDSDR